jgi:hypothetical protein
MSLTHLEERLGRKTEYDHNTQTVANGPPPAYNTNGVQEDRDPRWFDVRYWSKKALILSALAVVIVIVIIIAVSVVEVKKNAYPDYSQLNYTLVDQCMASLASVTTSTNTGSSLWGFILR